MFEKLLDLSDGDLLVPLLFVIGGVAIVKAAFSLHRSKSSDRRDFLDLWCRGNSRDDLWLEVSIRHLFGTYLPASIVRSLMQSPQAGRALLEVSNFWELIEIDDETLQVSWKNPAHANAQSRTFRVIGLNLFYALSMGLGMVCAFVALSGLMMTAMTVCFWFYAVFLTGVALRCLQREDVLKTAHTGAPRWLGLP